MLKQNRTQSLSVESGLIWSIEAQNELKKITSFVRGKIKRNTEKYAQTENMTEINLEVMYAAKEFLNT